MLRLFGFKKKEKPIFYLLMDRDSHVLGKADLLNDLSEPNLQMKITEGSANRVEEVETVQVVPSDTKVPVLMGKLIMRRGNNIVLEPMRKLGEGVRRNFRMPVAFESFAYFPWGGRAPLRSIDLSCGGLAFYSPANLNVGDSAEIVIPITTEGPLIVKSEILRRKDDSGPIRQYAARFTDIIADEEALLLEAVFNEQMESIRSGKGR